MLDLLGTNTPAYFAREERKFYCIVYWCVRQVPANLNEPAIIYYLSALGLRGDWGKEKTDCSMINRKLRHIKTWCHIFWSENIWSSDIWPTLCFVNSAMNKSFGQQTYGLHYLFVSAMATSIRQQTFVIYCVLSTQLWPRHFVNRNLAYTVFCQLSYYHINMSTDIRPTLCMDDLAMTMSFG